MMSKNCIYIIALHPIFNNKVISRFDKLSSKDSIVLYNLLLANYVDIFFNNQINADIIYYLDESNEQFIPKGYFPKEYNIVFGNTKEKNFNLNQLQQILFGNYENNVIVRANAIGMFVQTFRRIFDLLIIEDESLVIGKSINEKITFVGFNFFDNKIFDNVSSTNLDYGDLLIEVSKSNVYLHTLQDFQVIKNFIDFKNLHIELSKKDSLSYCSQQMHERFTNLFIEYKELLK